jgi:hypothetical protein
MFSFYPQASDVCKTHSSAPATERPYVLNANKKLKSTKNCTCCKFVCHFCDQLPDLAKKSLFRAGYRKNVKFCCVVFGVSHGVWLVFSHQLSVSTVHAACPTIHRNNNNCAHYAIFDCVSNCISHGQFRQQDWVPETPFNLFSLPLCCHGNWLLASHTDYKLFYTQLSPIIINLNEFVQTS